MFVNKKSYYSLQLELIRDKALNAPNEVDEKDIIVNEIGNSWLPELYDLDIDSRKNIKKKNRIT